MMEKEDNISENPDSILITIFKIKTLNYNSLNYNFAKNKILIDISINFKEVEELNREDIIEELEEEEDENIDEDENNIKTSNLI